MAVMEAFPVPYRGLLFLDQVAVGRYTLTNIGTYEKVLLPPGIWNLQFSFDGEDCSLLHTGLDDTTVEVPMGQYLKKKCSELRHRMLLSRSWVIIACPEGMLTLSLS